MKVFVNSNPMKDINFIKNRIDAIKGVSVVKFPDKDTSIAVSIGGDGTFLDTVHKLDNYHVLDTVPILGINQGTLGYLTMFDEETGINIIERISKEDAFVEKYKYLAIDALFGSVPLQSGIVEEFLHDSDEMIRGSCFGAEQRHMLDALCHGNIIGTALNDVVVSRKNASIIDIRVLVNGKHMTNYRGDGVIVSTATGLTGYSFSCGAPFIDPRSDAIIVTPIAAHTVMSRSVIFPAESKVSLIIDEVRQNDNGSAAVISIDGVETVAYKGMQIDIRQSEKEVRMCVPNDDNFFNRIYKKMF